MPTRLGIAILSATITTSLALQATTTAYQDESAGACGCGSLLNSYTYTAAGSPAIFGNGSWCGTGCGQCYQLTSTGASPPEQGEGGGTGTSIVVMVNNLCPHEGNEEWCPELGGTNTYGYSAHFDIDASSGAGGWSLLGWDNPVVDFAPVTCPDNAVTAFKSSECALQQ
ncbi:hypothetical protein FRB90_002828 [Tulasnella sp. 427]|nr:hypothetical protein FRB90_002828 [Tulasnella sp. 427]